MGFLVPSLEDDEICWSQWSQGTTETSRSYTTHALTVTYAHTAETKKPNIGMNEPHIVVHIQYYIQ